jgi:hypothetical protein
MKCYFQRLFGSITLVRFFFGVPASWLSFIVLGDLVVSVSYCKFLFWFWFLFIYL